MLSDSTVEELRGRPFVQELGLSAGPVDDGSRPSVADCLGGG
jgi:hypothetical protein